jgi:hypothetical protein
MRQASASTISGHVAPSCSNAHVSRFSTCRIADIEQARQIFGEAQAHAAAGDAETSEDLLAKAYDLVPAIRLVLTVEYTEEDDLAPLTGVKTADEILDKVAAYCQRISDSGL